MSSFKSLTKPNARKRRQLRVRAAEEKKMTETKTQADDREKQFAAENAKYPMAWSARSIYRIEEPGRLRCCTTCPGCVPDSKHEHCPYFRSSDRHYHSLKTGEFISNHCIECVQCGSIHSRAFVSLASGVSTVGCPHLCRYGCNVVHQHPNYGPMSSFCPLR
jgi:hypothetical protein